MAQARLQHWQEEKQLPQCHLWTGGELQSDVHTFMFDACVCKLLLQKWKYDLTSCPSFSFCHMTTQLSHRGPIKQTMMTLSCLQTCMVGALVQLSHPQLPAPPRPSGQTPEWTGCRPQQRQRRRGRTGRPPHPGSFLWLRAHLTAPDWGWRRMQSLRTPVGHLSRLLSTQSRSHPGPGPDLQGHIRDHRELRHPAVMMTINITSCS